MKLPIPICQFMNTPDEWHAWWFGYYEQLGKPKYKSPPAYVMTEQVYYNMGCRWGRRVRMVEDLACCTFFALLFIAGVYAIGDLVTLWAIRCLGG